MYYNDFCARFYSIYLFVYVYTFSHCDTKIVFWKCIYSSYWMVFATFPCVFIAARYRKLTHLLENILSTQKLYQYTKPGDILLFNLKRKGYKNTNFRFSLRLVELTCLYRCVYLTDGKFIFNARIFIYNTRRSEKRYVYLISFYLM